MEKLAQTISHCGVREQRESSFSFYKRHTPYEVFASGSRSYIQGRGARGKELVREREGGDMEKGESDESSISPPASKLRCTVPRGRLLSLHRPD